jgi:hypothetical protein
LCIKLVIKSSLLFGSLEKFELSVKEYHGLLTLGGVSCKHCCSGKAIIITHCECVFLCTLSFPARAMLSSVAFPVLQYFYTLSHKRHNFRKSYWTQNECLIFTTTFLWNISHSKKIWAKYDKKIYIGLHLQYPLVCPILMKLEFSRKAFEKY